MGLREQLASSPAHKICHPPRLRGYGRCIAAAGSLMHFANNWQHDGQRTYAINLSQ